MEIFDSEASTGRALQLYRYGKVIVVHRYRSIMPDRDEIYWRLRFTGSRIWSK